MGDFATPAAAANGGSLCLNNNLSSSLGGAGIGVNNAPHGPPPGNSATHSGGGGGTNGSSGVPKHSTVVERLRQRIEGCRRHHVNCENRYQQAQAEQLELERRDTVSLYQRTLEQRAKKSGAGGGGSKQQQHPSSKQQQDAECATAEQRNHTLIMLQETVKRKLEGARSPLNGEQQNGACDSSFSPTSKRIRKDVPGIEGINSLPNNLPLPSISPLHQLDIKPSLPLQNSGTHAGGLDDLGKNGGLPEIKLPINGCTELEDSFNILHNNSNNSKELKQEPLDDPSCMDNSDTSLSNQNKLFSDINLNDQEWQELIDELANTVPEDDIQDLFNEDFEEKKEPEFPRPATEIQESASVKSDPSHSPFAHVPLGSPQVRPSSSGPPFSNVPTASSIPSVSSAPPAPLSDSSPANCVVQSPQTPNQAHTPSQTQSRPGNGYLINPTTVATAAPGPGQVAVPSTDLSPAEQLKQMAAQQQQRAKLMQQKQQQQQQQQQHPNQASSWSPVGPPSSPYGGPFSTDKPNSPMIYPQAFNNQNPVVPPPASNPQKTTMNNYLPQNHMNMISQQPNNLGTNSLSKQTNMLSYGNTKPLTHFNADLSQRMTPPMANPSKNPMMPYMQQQQQQQPQQPQMQAQMTHLSEEQKRMLIMKQKGMMNQTMAYGTLPSLGQDQHAVGLSRSTGPMQSSVPAGSSNVGTSSVNASFLGGQPQAALMKQMLIEQRAQLHMMEQQKQQFLREQRQQQQILAEQQQQQQQQQQSHLPRQHLQQQQRNPYPVQQVNQFQGSPQDIAAVRNQAALQSMRTSRMMSQNTSMMTMGASQNTGAMSAAAGQSEMGMAPYSSPAAGQPGMYNMNTGMSQMLQHPNQSSMSLAHNPSQGPRQPTSTQGVGMVSSFGPNMLVNSAISQQHQQMKGPVGQVLPRPQAPRLQNMMGPVPQGAQNWQTRGLQGIPGRTSGEIGPFNNGAAYPMQSAQPRLPKQHFPQGISQSVMDTSGTVRTLNPAMGRQMLQPLPGQQGTNNQARPMVMPTISQAVPTMAGFNQSPAQQIPGGSFAQSNQGQIYERNPTQDISYSYSNEGAGGSFPSIADSTDLVDSIIKGGPGDEWMQELDELFGNP
ncbi:mastermind-like protein 3 isoform X2 [Podarcis raffonei]|uniref:mastermind-like protein 3 isoform X2 n=1 Tax=Podarcis raffonei TaxID=65483 RepID=UPI0023296836|nr:mastermind-like protein 3 isoform X2 [Podarcis raffonei]